MSKNRPLQGSLFASARSKLALYDGEDIPVRGVTTPPVQYRVQDEKYDSIGSRRVISKVDESLTVCASRGYAEKDEKRINFNYSDLPLYDDKDLYSAEDTKGKFSRGSDLPDLSDDCEPDRWSRNSKDIKRIIHKDSNDNNRIGRISSSENNATRVNRGIQMKLNVKPPAPALVETCNAFKFNDDEEDDDIANDNEVQILEGKAESTKNMRDVTPVVGHGRSNETRKYNDESYYSRITKQGHHDQSSVDKDRYSENSNLTRSYDRYLEDRDPCTSSISPGNGNSVSRDLRNITRDEHRDSLDLRSSSKDEHKEVDGRAEEILYTKYKSYIGNTRISLDRSPEHDPKKELSKTYRQNISPNHDKDRTDLYSREIESYKMRDGISDKKYENYPVSSADNNLTGEGFRDCDELSGKLEKGHSAEVVIEYPVNAAQGPPAEQYGTGYGSASFENYQLPSGGQSDQIFSESNTGYNMYYESESINTQQNPLNYQSNWNQIQAPSYNYQDMYQASQYMPYQSQPAPYYPPRVVHQFPPRPQNRGHMVSNQYTNRQKCSQQYIAAFRDEDTSGSSTEALMSDPAVREELKQQNENLAKQRAVYYKKCADLYENLEDLKTEKQKLLKMKKSPDSDLLLKQNIHNQNDVQNKLKAVKNVIGMLTKIIEDNQSKSEERSPSHGHGNLLRRSPSLESGKKKHLNQRSKSPKKHYEDDKIRHEDSSKRNEESFKNREDIERKKDEKKKDINESDDKNDKIRDDFKFDSEREHEVTTAKFDREREHEVATAKFDREREREVTTAKFDRERDHEVTTTKTSEIENSSSIKSQLNLDEVKSNVPWLKKPTKVINNEKVLDLKPQEPEEVNYVYYDPEVHWCKICNLFPRTAKDYLVHLHSDEHKAKLKEMNISEFPWHKNIQVPPALPGLRMERVPIRGLQFLMPVTAWYCKICNEWIGDLHCASAHLKSKCHRSNYNEHNEKNPYWEVDWLASRMRAYEDYVDMKNKMTKQDMENSSSSTSVDKEPDNKSTKSLVTSSDKTADIEKPEALKEPEIVEKIEKERTNISGKPEKERTTISGKSDPKETKYKSEDRNRRTNLEEKSRHGKLDEGLKRRSDYRSKDYEKQKRDRSSRDLKRKSEERRRSRSDERKKRKNSDKRETNLNSDVEYDDSEKTDRLIEEWMAPINKNVDKEFSDLKSKLKNREVNKEKEKRKYKEDDKECKIVEPKDRSPTRDSKPTEKKLEKSSSSTKNEVLDKGSNGKSDNSCTEENKTKIIFHNPAQKCKFPFIGKMPFNKNLKKNRILSKNENPEEKKTTLTGQDMSKIFKELEKNSELEEKNTEPVVLDNETRTKDFKETLSILFPGSSDNSDKNDIQEIPIPSNIHIPRTVELFPTNCLPLPAQISFPPSGTLPISQNVPAPNTALRFPYPNVSMNNPGFPPQNGAGPSSRPLMFMQPPPPPPVNIHHYRETDPLGFLTHNPVDSHISEMENESNSSAENKTKKNAMSQKKRKRLQRIKQSEEELQLRINEAQKKLETHESSSSNTGELGLNEYMELELLGIDAEDSAFNDFAL